MAVFEGEIDDGVGLSEGVTAVDREDEEGFHGGGCVEGADAGEDSEDVVIFGDIGGGNGPWSCAKLEVSKKLAIECLYVTRQKRSKSRV
jgi:hypothetical protein